MEWILHERFHLSFFGSSLSICLFGILHVCFWCLAFVAARALSPPPRFWGAMLPRCIAFFSHVDFVLDPSSRQWELDNLHVGLQPSRASTPSKLCAYVFEWPFSVHRVLVPIWRLSAWAPAFPSRSLLGFRETICTTAFELCAMGFRLSQSPRLLRSHHHAILAHPLLSGAGFSLCAVVGLAFWFVGALFSVFVLHHVSSNCHFRAEFCIKQHFDNRWTAPCQCKKCFCGRLTLRVIKFISPHGWPQEFNASLGYPGEGPNAVPLSWSISTLNVGSLKTSTFWKGSDDVVMCLQETRIGKNNFRKSSNDVAATGRTLFCGALLPGIIRADGHRATMHGGTAVIAPAEITAPFNPDSDSSGKYAKVFESKRVNAVWVQASTSLRVLVFSVYLKAGASTCVETHNFNNDLLKDVLEISVQFGSIPIIVAGDFQTDPMNYTSASEAVNFHGWQDPLLQVQEDGICSRPLTYSRDCTFSGPGDNCSSIDGILVNQVAFAALSHIEVLATSDSQHRPIRAKFQWDQLQLVGSVHVKTAPLDTCTLPKPTSKLGSGMDEIADEVWDNHFLSRYQKASDASQKWQLVNEFCLQTLTTAGATWGHGKRVRGAPPVFRKKMIFPGQLPSGVATTHKASRLYNTLNRLWEIYTRIQRPSPTLSDAIITQRTCRRAWRALQEWDAPHLWGSPSSPTLQDVHVNIQWIKLQAIESEACLKAKRIQNWKSKIQSSAIGTKRFIYHHLRNKACDEPANLVLDSDENIVYNPCQAMQVISSTWDDVFSANVLRDDPTQMLQVIWPYLDQQISTFDIPPLTGAEIMATIQQRKPLAAPGLDGWRTSELQALPMSCCNQIAVFFRSLEEDLEFDMPQVLVTAKQIILNKVDSFKQEVDNYPFPTYLGIYRHSVPPAPAVAKTSLFHCTMWGDKGQRYVHCQCRSPR